MVLLGLDAAKCNNVKALLSFMFPFLFYFGYIFNENIKIFIPSTFGTIIRMSTNHAF